MNQEANVTINGVELTSAQSMALRVAVDTFIAEMQELNALGDDEMGIAIARGYRERCGEVRKLIGGGER